MQMCKRRFTFVSEKLENSSTFLEASREELRVLISLVALSGEADEEEIASLSGVSLARVRSSLTLWEEEGVIAPFVGVSEEFENASFKEKEYIMSSSEAARTIRDEGLAQLIDECARLCGGAAFSSEDIKKIAALVSELGLTDEYILTLASYLESKKKLLTASKIFNEAKRLSEKMGIDTTEALEDYISHRNKEGAREREFRRILGIYGRSLAPVESEYFERWESEFGFGGDILEEAYNVSVRSIGSYSIDHINAILTDWHNAECKTVSDCRKRSEEKKAEYSAPGDKRPEKTRKKSTEEKPRYGNFDANEALALALSRSFDED